MKKGKRKNSREAANAHRNKMTMIGITFVVCLLMITLLVQGHRLNANASANERREAELEQQIEQENQRTEEIQELEEYMKSDEYLEKEAKDKLGLIDDGEIIFKESDGK
jgi:cell division protein DivIC